MAGRTRKSVLELDAGAGSMPGLAMAATTPLADFEATYGQYAEFQDRRPIVKVWPSWIG